MHEIVRSKGGTTIAYVRNSSIYMDTIISGNYKFYSGEDTNRNMQRCYFLRFDSVHGNGAMTVVRTRKH